jgi:RNA-directed DNA polymerase
MKVRHRKGLATHSGLESCGGGREDVVEALIGEPAGQPLSREIGKSGAPTLLSYAEGNTEGGATREPPEGSTRSKTLSMRGSPSCRNWEISPASDGRSLPDTSGKAMRRKPDIQAGEKSDACVVPTNDPNKSGGSKPTHAEDREGRRAAKGNAEQPPVPRTQSRTRTSMRLDGVREAALRSKETRFTALMHHITPGLLTESFRHLKRSAAPGVDGVTCANTRKAFPNGSRGSGMRCNPAATERCRHDGSISPNGTAGSVRWASLRWRTRSSSRRWSRC